MTTPNRRNRARTGYGRLDRDRILDAALTMAARPGMDGMRVRELGEELGADPSAIYRHFRNKEELIAALIDRLMHMVLDRSTVGPEDWREFLSQACDHFLEVFLEYPSIAAEAVRATALGTGGTRLAASVLAALAQSGLKGDDLVRHYAALTGFVVSFCGLAARDQQLSGKPIESEPWAEPERNMAPVTRADLVPLLEKIRALDYLSTYRSGIKVILDAVSAATAHPIDGEEESF